MSVKILWHPSGFTLDQIGDKRLTEVNSISDGDTPNIRMSIRMLSIDTPETHHMGIAIRDWPGLILDLADWIETGRSPVAPDLAAHLLLRLRRADGQDAYAVHNAQGKAATEAFKELTARRLRRPTGSVRPLFVRVADERFDGYGRLLAYVAPSFTAQERAALPVEERTTFNFDMVANGHAASFIIFPSIPNETDLPLVQAAARRAVEEGRGAWADPWLLTGYEYRMVAKLILLMRRVKAGTRLGAGEWSGWVNRYCVDISTAEIFAPQEYVAVAPWNRLFLWSSDLRRAVAELNLTPAGSLAGA